MPHTKKFIGIVDRSEANNFADAKTGEAVELWKLVLIFSEDRGKIFNIAKSNPCYTIVQSVQEGDEIEVECTSNVQQNNSIKWTVIGVRIVKQQGQTV